MIRLTIKTIFLITIFTITFSYAAEFPTWNNDSIIVTLEHDDTDGSFITYLDFGASPDWYCEMYLKDVTPAQFALVYNTLKDFMVDDSRTSLRVIYEVDGSDNKMTGVKVVGKTGDP